MQLNNTGRLFLLFIFIAACSSPKEKNETEQYLTAIRGSDTIEIKLLRYDETFYGKYELNGPGDRFIEGEIEGKVQNDTLLGSLLYTSYGWRNTKRRAFALKYIDGVYLQGKGQEMIYMNIPYFLRHTLDFSDEDLFFKVEKASDDTGQD